MQTTWLKYKKNVKGRDPLGVQAIGIHLYGVLLPGITNVTDRLRYYSFYPWLLSLLKSEPAKDFISLLRSGEFLFGLVSESFDNKRGRASHMVGVTAMDSALPELRARGSLKLSPYTTLKPDKIRYFQNRTGGFGQYYLGSLGALGILGRSEKEYSLYERGIELSQAFDPGDIGKVFFDCVKNDNVKKAQLEQFEKELPASLLRPASAEYKLLIKYLFEEDTPRVTDKTYYRRDTLRLIIRLVMSQKNPCYYWELLNILFYGSDNKGKAFQEPAELVNVARLWRYYTRHEYFSLGFSAVFSRMQEHLAQGPCPENAMADICWKSFLQLPVSPKISKPQREALEFLKDDPDLAAFMEWLKRNYAKEKPWNEGALSEYAISNYIQNMEQNSAALLGFGILLISLALLNENEFPPDQMGPFHFQQVLSDYPLNIEYVKRDIRTQAANLKISGLVRFLINERILIRHYHIAMSKLFAHGLSTFRFMREEGILSSASLEIDPITNTSPRLGKAMQFLSDLGILNESKVGFTAGDPSLLKLAFGK